MLPLDTDGYFLIDQSRLEIKDESLLEKAPYVAIKAFFWDCNRHPDNHPAFLRALCERYGTHACTSTRAFRRDPENKKTFVSDLAGKNLKVSCMRSGAIGPCLQHAAPLFAVSGAWWVRCT